MKIFFLPYARFLVNSADGIDFDRLEKDYAYISIYSYAPFKRPGWNVKIQQTPVIDLKKSEEEIFGQFRRDAKAGIKKSAETEGLKFAVPDTDAKISFKFYKTVKRQDGALPDIETEFKNCVYFNAYYKGRMLVTMSFYDNGHVLRSKHIASLRKESKEHSRLAGAASRRLFWEIFKYAKRKGYEKVDLGGIVLDNEEKKGIADFKSSFGGEILDIYICRFEKPIFSKVRSLLKYAHKNIN